MYFYRLMSKEELKDKKIHNNKNSFYDFINTHKYKRGKNYVHLFLNAESCFEDFRNSVYDNCIIAKFDIPDGILFKYGIKLGGYSTRYNSYTTKYRSANHHNAIGGYSFWLPEIAIEAKDFNYNWLIDISETKDNNGKTFIKDSFLTDEVDYKQVVYDGYLLGYGSENELEKKYENLLKTKKKIINILKTTRQININPKDLNNDSMLAVDILLNYGLEHGLISEKADISITLSSNIKSSSINIISDDNVKNKIVINKNYQHSVPSFCAMLYKLGFNVDKNILQSISNDDEVVIDYSLIKK